MTSSMERDPRDSLLCGMCGLFNELCMCLIVVQSRSDPPWMTCDLLGLWPLVVCTCSGLAKRLYLPLLIYTEDALRDWSVCSAHFAQCEKPWENLWKNIQSRIGLKWDLLYELVFESSLSVLNVLITTAPENLWTEKPGTAQIPCTTNHYI